MSIVTITNVRIFDGEKILPDQSRVSFDTSTGLFTAAADGDNIIDGSGCTLLPGFWDSHVHLANPTPQAVPFSLRLVKDMAACGITTAVDCGKMGSDHCSLLRKDASSPYILYTGNFATSTGSMHSKFATADTSSIVDSPEASAKFVEERVKQGADFIKIVADVPGPTQEIINELSRCAQEHGMLTIVHAARRASFLMALDAKPPVSIITHVPIDEPITQDEAVLMKERGIVAVPTLIMSKAIVASGKIPGVSYPPALASVRALHAAGVPILVGTDSNQSPIAFVKHGQALRQEMKLLEEAGLSPTEILQGATHLPAKKLQMKDRGVIQPGKRADMVLVKGNPTLDIQVLKEVIGVWKAGERIYFRQEDALSSQATVAEEL